MYIGAPLGRLGLRGAAARRSATWPLGPFGLGATSHTCPRYAQLRFEKITRILKQTIVSALKLESYKRSCYNKYYKYILEANMPRTTSLGSAHDILRFIQKQYPNGKLKVSSRVAAEVLIYCSTEWNYPVLEVHSRCVSLKSCIMRQRRVFVL